MFYQTRDLFPYALARTEMQNIFLVFSEKVLQDDGSFVLNPIEEIEIAARVILLTSSELQRLQEGGTTVNKGVSISFSSMLDKVPDFIRLENPLTLPNVSDPVTILKVVTYAFEEGASVMVADVLPGVI